MCWTTAPHLKARWRYWACSVSETLILSSSLQNHFKIVDSAVYNDLMVFCVTKFSTVLDKQMGRTDSNKPPNFASGKWKKLSVIVKSYLSNFIHFVSQLTGTRDLTL
jgi:hypothetical protein